MDAKDLLLTQRRAVLLPSILAIHSSEHIGEALTIRGLGGFSLGV